MQTNSFLWYSTQYEGSPTWEKHEIDTLTSHADCSKTHK
jgi:hypothetical protein